MIRIFIIFAFLLIGSNGLGKTIVLLDTGVSLKKNYQKFVVKKINVHNKVDKDEDGHGTHLAGILIDFGKKPSNKIISIKIADNNATVLDYLLGLREAISLNPDIINISFTHDESNDIEKVLLNQSERKGIKVVVAAGNKSRDLDYYPTYPCSYSNKNIYCVGSESKDGKRSSFSNFGSSVKYWEVGEDVVSFSLKEDLEIQSGTSQSAALFSQKLK